MGAIRYAGPVSSDGSSLGLKRYADAAAAQGLTQAQVDQRISSQLTGYVGTDYVDQQDALRASSQYVADQDAKKIKLTAKGAASGVATFDSSGMIPATQLDLAERRDAFLYSAGSYNASTITVSSTAAFSLLATMTISNAEMNRGISHFPFIFGYWEVRGISGTARPVVEVRLGGTTGLLVAKGMGSSRGNYHACNILPFGGNDVPPAATHTYYFYGRILNTGSVEFTGTNGGVPSSPNAVALLCPAYGVTT